MRYLFGSLIVDAGARVLTDASRPVHLTRKALDLLLLLLEHRPNAVSKEQINARLWPDTFVSEASLQTLIHEIRQAIDRQGAHESWIRTVHGVGYRFAGEAVAEEPSGLAPTRPAAWLIGESIRVALAAGENVIGRDVEDVLEIDAPTVSRRHARITVGEACSIEDLGSKNGTWLNGERVTVARPLGDESVVALGSLRLVFRLARHTQSTESAEAAPEG
jgi:DNA-binding winged helix-turn-helix (wHTH) protein